MGQLNLDDEVLSSESFIMTKCKDSSFRTGGAHIISCSIIPGLRENWNLYKQQYLSDWRHMNLAGCAVLQCVPPLCGNEKIHALR